MTRWAQLWAGPMDGERVFLGDGDLPPRVGMHRAADGALVPIRSRSMADGQHPHVAVYERATVDVVCACRAATGTVFPAWLTDDDATGGAVYVFRDVIIRWQAAAS